jgi:hypothetical protein
VEAAILWRISRGWGDGEGFGEAGPCVRRRRGVRVRGVS